MKTIKMICVFALAPIIAALFVACGSKGEALVKEEDGSWESRAFHQNAGKCEVEAEDGRMVPCTYYTKDECKVQAEDESWVPCTFYSYKPE